MYKQFYKLHKNPFELTPDPSFLFTSKQHNEALASLYYGVKQHKGFIVLSGEVGAGKTLLVSCLLQLLSKTQIAFAYVFNPRLDGLDFLRYIAGDFRLPVAGKTKSEILLALSTFLIERYRHGSTTVLIVDEAHHLSTDVLEEIRLLGNLETPHSKLLQIVLAGQPELDQKLDSPELRQLKQRIVMRSRLKPLDIDETLGYIHKRLELSGCSQPEDLFPIETIVEVHKYSAGFPRLINILCENALIQGFGKQVASIAPGTIAEIAVDLGLTSTGAEPEPSDTGIAEKQTNPAGTSLQRDKNGRQAMKSSERKPN
jgi:general secretion pathway protein A